MIKFPCFFNYNKTGQAQLSRGAEVQGCKLDISGFNSSIRCRGNE